MCICSRMCLSASSCAVVARPPRCRIDRSIALMHRLSRARASSRGHDRRSVHTALLVVHVEELPRGRPSESENVRVKQDKHGTREQDRLPRAGKSCGPPRSAGIVRVKQDPHARHQQDARGLPGAWPGLARLGGAAWRGLAGRGAAWPGLARLGGAAWRGSGQVSGVTGRPVTPVSCFWVRRVGFVRARCVQIVATPCVLLAGTRCTL